MKRLLPRILGFGPLLLPVALGVYTAWQRSSIDAALPGPNGLVWHSSSGRLTVQTSEEREGTLSHYIIRILRDDGSIAREDRFAIDWNAGLAGGGFVRAVQADEDPELEVAAWASNFDSSIETRVPFLLDHTDGDVQRRPFDEASEAAKALASRWLQSHVVRNLEMTALVILVVVYYVLFALIAGVARLLRSLRKPRPSS